MDDVIRRRLEETARLITLAIVAGYESAMKYLVDDGASGSNAIAAIHRVIVTIGAKTMGAALRENENVTRDIWSTFYKALSSGYGDGGSLPVLSPDDCDSGLEAERSFGMGEHYEAAMLRAAKGGLKS